MQQSRKKMLPQRESEMGEKVTIVGGEAEELWLQRKWS
jgi:hypothetical protein